jgi:hypothetical protein
METEHDYRIEELSSTFLKHALLCEENDKRMLQQFRENYPDSPIPQHMLNPFNIAKALSVMSSEIEKLKIKAG